MAQKKRRNIGFYYDHTFNLNLSGNISCYFEKEKQAMYNSISKLPSSHLELHIGYQDPHHHTTVKTVKKNKFYFSPEKPRSFTIAVMLEG